MQAFLRSCMNSSSRQSPDARVAERVAAVRSVPRGAPRKPCRWLCVAREETRPRAEGDVANRNASSPEESMAGERGPCGDLEFAGISEMFVLRAARFAAENAKSSSLRAW